ncbi:MULTISPECIES: glycerate kinase [unclassified Mycobacterium]|uniref:glycerate kinase family protein n=1 Tax=unclassified Mycobacterium TaxID=2642494 RepID=UPI0029C85EA9|nr:MULTISPECIES: glycerate kinase [unclassified Mycobacterium]
MTGQALRVLIAPDCYGDSLTAVQAAQAIADGWRSGRADDVLTLAPQSDGGPGFVDVLASRLGERRSARVSGPLSSDVTAEWVFDPASRTAYVECAQACGLALLPEGPTVETALDAHSGGVGQLLDEALQAGARTIVVGLGGSACTDGGRGLVDALGGLSQALTRLDGVDLIAATDVEHPLLGVMGAAHVFGPQKGADPDTVAVLEQRLADWASELAATTGRDVRAEPGAGAAGGLGAALLALGGRRESGAAVIAEHTGLAGDVAAAQLIITGEGRFDDQSLHGKVVSALAAGAGDAPVVVLAGQVTLDEPTLRGAGIAEAHSIADYAGSIQLAMDDAANQLTGVARRTAADWAYPRLESRE